MLGAWSCAKGGARIHYEHFRGGNVHESSDIPTDQRWFWMPEWQSGEAEATQQIADGECSEAFTSAAELFAAIDDEST
ncbi:hypothetical protein J2S53_002981 [Actinopolyspora lacussalsi]|nr:hypothetical protein [Actinopolyspora lacussalsi]